MFNVQDTSIPRQIRGLTIEERDGVFDLARHKIAGPEPQPKMFMRTSINRHSPRVINFVLFLCIVFLIAAFLPTALRLAQAGKESFCASSPSDPTLCMWVGVSTVVLAEIGQLIFFFALAVLTTTTGTRRMFYLGIAISTAIAIMGNAQIAQPWNHGGYIFYYLIDFGPSILVMILGFFLKGHVLDQSESRQKAQTLLEQAQKDRLAILEDPKAHHSWNRIYSQYLRQALQKVNAHNRAIFNDLTVEQIRFLVRREMLQEEWYVDPSKQGVIERVQLTEQVDARANGHSGRKEIRPVNGGWKAFSRLTGKDLSKTYSSEKRAQAALNLHYRGKLRSQ